MTKMKCPIGLICEHFDCDRYYCQQLARGWDIPFLFTEPESIKAFGLIVLLPQPEAYGDNDCDALLWRTDIRNEFIASERFEKNLHGYWESIPLPYRPPLKGEGLIVTDYLRLDEDVSLSCHVLYRVTGRKYIPCWEAFLPPVPIDGWKNFYLTPPMLTEADFEDACVSEECNQIILKNGFSLLFHYHFSRELRFSYLNEI